METTHGDERKEKRKKGIKDYTKEALVQRNEEPVMNILWL
jgi:hypothetical protein